MATIQTTQGGISYLAELLKEKSMDISAILKDAITLNQNLVNQPFQSDHVHLELSYNVWEFYQDIKKIH